MKQSFNIKAVIVSPGQIVQVLEGCSFCFHPNGRIYRERSLDDFFAEFDHNLTKYDLNLLNIADELFSMKKRRILEFCERIAPYNIHWTSQLHVRVIDAEIIKAMKASNCALASYGIESANEKILVSMQKKSTRAQIDSALKLTHENKVGIQGNLIFGDKAETVETANDTMDWWANNREYRISLSMMAAYPGAKIYEYGLKDQRFKDPKDALFQGVVNMSSLDDSSMDNIREKVWTFRDSLFIHGKVLAFDQLDEFHETRGYYFRIKWKCCHCEEENDFKRVLLGAPHHIQSLLVTCRHCFASSDIQNLARQPIAHELADQLLAEATTLKDNGAIQEAVVKYSEITRIETPGADAPEAYYRAHLELARLMLRAGEALAASDLLSKAVRFKAYDPIYQLTYAQALIAEGAYSSAILHCEAAYKLLPGHTGELKNAISSVFSLARQMQAKEKNPTFFTGRL